ncbi:tetratricopeptide repeat protein [Myxococcus faecalis]|uniref:hypothetical protein n=1 Tax=Myxococcus faecalis TaxID=3115646 RepID=UPI003CE816F4
MRRKLQELQDTLGGFVDQRDHLLLVIGCHEAEAAWVHKTLKGLDEETPSDLFLLFAHEARSATQYVTHVLANLEAQLEGANLTRKQNGEAPWPALPGRCQDPRESPGARLRSAIEHVRGLLPPDGDHRLVWALVPMKIEDRTGYSHLVGQLLPHDGFQPWMRSLRIIVRDEKEPPFLVPALRKLQVPGVLVYEPDLSTAALTDSLAQESVDPALPVPERMQALLQLAALDYAHKRYPAALEKYGLLHTYYAEQGLKELQALCLQGAGDVLRAVGKLALAKERYQQGLAVAVNTLALPILINLSMAAGDVSLELKQYTEAEGYFDITDRVAAKALNPYPKADALEKLGLARYLRKDLGKAVVTWTGAAAFCRSVEYTARLRSVLQRLEKVYGEAGMVTEQRACKKELQSLPREGQT